MRTRISRLLIVLPASLLLVAPVSAAHAATPNPWSAYYPSAGTTCTSTVTLADGTTAPSEKTTVVAKSARKVVVRTSGAGRSTFQLLPGGKMRETAAMTERDSGIRVRLAMLVNYPSPAKLLQHRPGAGQVTMTMTLPPRLAKAALKSGRTLTISSTYRMAGLGSRSITLADPAATTVDALGVRGTMRSLKFANAKPAFARELKKEMRPMFASIFGTEWIARGRGVVQSVSTTTDGVAETQTQVSCS